MQLLVAVGVEKDAETGEAIFASEDLPWTRGEVIVDKMTILIASESLRC